MKQKLIGLAVIAVPLLIIIGAGWFVWQVESYMKENDAWKAQAVQQVNANTQNILTIGQFLSNQASSTKK